MMALRTEAYRLRQCGFEPYIAVVDNGSVDGTSELLEAISDIHVIRNSENIGQARARNQLIEYSLSLGTKYTFFVDDDIHIVPHSVAEMANWLQPGQSL